MEDQNFLTKLRPVEPKASKYAELDDSSSSDSEKLSSDDLKHGVTKKIKKMARRKKKYRFITDEMRVMLVDAVDNGEKIKHAAKRLKINYSSAKSIFKVFKREGRFSKKVLKPKAPPKAKPAPKMKDESAFSEQSEEIDDDEEESLDSPEQSCNPFLKKEPEEKENIKQELNSPVPVAEPEAVQMPSETLDMRPAEVDTGIFLQQLHQKQQRQQRNYQSFGLPFGNMVAPKVSPNMLPSPFMGGTPSNQGISFSNLYAQQQQMNFQKPQFGAANMLSGLKPNNFNGLEASYQHFGNLIPQQQQNMSQMNYPSMLGNVYNQQQQQQQQQQILLQQMNYQQNPYSYQNNVRFGPNMNYLEAMMAREQGFRMEEMNSNVVKFEYSDI